METIQYGVQEERKCLESDMRHGTVCGPCQSDNTAKQAEVFCSDCSEYLCNACYAFHTKLSATRNHKTSEIPRTKLTRDTCTEHCQVHPDETIKYFCKTHDSLGCAACIVLFHRSCRDVEYIPGNAEILTSKNKFREFEEILNYVNNTSKTVARNAEVKRNQFENYYSGVLRTIKEYRKQIDDILDVLENTMYESMKQFKKERMDVLYNVIDTCKGMETETDIMLATIDNLRKKGKHCDIFVRAMKFKERVDSLKNQLETINDNLEVKEYRFQPNVRLLEKFKGLNALGELIEVELEAVKDVLPKLLPWGDLNVRSPTDSIPSKITSCIALPNRQTVILSDYNNSKIKMFDTKEMSLQSEIEISGRPWDMTFLEQERLAVTVPMKKMVLFLHIDQELSLVTDITVDRECHGIAQCNKDTIIVTYGDHNRLEMMTVGGNVVSSISNRPNQPMIFNRPLYVTMSSGMLYVTNFSDNSIVCLQSDGSCVSRYTDSQLVGPLNLAVDALGIVYVCGKWSHNIHQVTNECKKGNVCIAEEDLERQPYCISYAKHEDRFYVGILDTDQVKIFQAVRDVS